MAGRATNSYGDDSSPGERGQGRPSLLHFALIVMALLFVGLFLTGCQSPPPVYLPPISSVKIDDSLTNIPIIDIHTHSFDARDIPVKHIALGRRDSIYTFWIPDRWARQFGGVLLAATPRENETNVTGDEMASRAVTNLAAEAPISAEKLKRTAKYHAVQKVLDYRERQLRGEHPRPQLSLGEKIVLRLVAHYAREHEAATYKNSDTYYQEIIGFLYDLTRTDEQLVNKQFYKENSSNIVFRVSHMMDMGPTYGQREGGQLIPFASQIEKMDALQHSQPAAMTYFVAWSPFRDNTTEGESLRMVQDAVEHHHAFGVKVYPPAGYTAISNVIPRRPCPCWHAAPAQQWDSRYTCHGLRLTGGELDGRMLELLSWCASNQIPVFAHCMNSEMQARAGYGAMADVRYWRGLLEAHPALANLYLCLAHAGGEEWWFQESTNNTWGPDVYYLCTHYPHVYCEFGDLSGILDSTNQARFALTMQALCTTNATPEHPYPFGRKIMYGSDWFMPMAESRVNFLQAFQQVFHWDGLDPVYYRLFFYENALAYLNVRNRVNNKEFPPDPWVAAELSRLASTVRD